MCSIVHQTMTVRQLSPQVGISLDGPPSTQDSWFPGYAWSIAYCSRCYNHLGWRFTLVDENLVDHDDDLDDDSTEWVTEEEEEEDTDDEVDSEDNCVADGVDEDSDGPLNIAVDFQGTVSAAAIAVGDSGAPELRAAPIDGPQQIRQRTDDNNHLEVTDLDTSILPSSAERDVVQSFW
jgi:hypothetical protein